MSFSQTDTNFISHSLLPGCSIGTSFAVHQATTLQPQAQVAHSVPPTHCCPPSDSTHNLPHYELPVLMPITLQLHFP